LGTACSLRLQVPPHHSALEHFVWSSFQPREGVSAANTLRERDWSTAVTPAAGARSHAPATTVHLARRRRRVVNSPPPPPPLRHY